MMRYLTTLIAGLLIAGATQAADGKKVTIHWHGQSFFDIVTSAGTRIVLDPHAIEAYGPQNVEADLILISHLHNDHTQVEVISNFKKEKEKEMVRVGLKDLKGDGKRLDWNLIDEQFKDVHVKTVGVYHDDMQGMQRGKNAVFIIEVDGIRIVHLGDLGHTLTPALIKQIGLVDVLMIPVGGVYTINGSEAKKVVEQLKPQQYILPMHYGTRVYDDVLRADEFLDEQKKENIKQLDGNELVVDPGFKPAEPVIVLLGWTSRK